MVTEASALQALQQRLQHVMVGAVLRPLLRTTWCCLMMTFRHAGDHEYLTSLRQFVTRLLLLIREP